LINLEISNNKVQNCKEMQKNSAVKRILQFITGSVKVFSIIWPEKYPMAFIMGREKRGQP